MKIEPFGERVAIKVLQPEETTAGGLVLATSKSDSNKGEIVAIGNEAGEFFSLGDKVIFTKGTGVNYTDGSDDYKILNTRDILCKVVED